MIVYKLVLGKLKDPKDRGSQVFTSLLGGALEEEYAYKYITNPTLGFLYAFSELQAAIDYADGATGVLSKDGVLRVFKCEADVVPGPAYVTSEDMESFWNERWWEFGEAWPHVVECPPATVWCRWVKPLETDTWTDGRILRAKKKEENPLGKKPLSMFPTKSKSYGW